MPRGIGTSSGVKLTRHRAVGERAEVLGDLRGVPVDPAHAVRAGRAHHLAAEEVGLGGLAGAAGAGGGDHDDVVVDQPLLDGRGQAERGDRRVAAGDRDPRRLPQHVALAGELGQAVGPGAGVGAAVELLPLGGVLEPVVGAAVDDERRPRRARAAIGPDWPCGSARKTTSWPASVSALVSTRTRSASGTRCGWRLPSVSPALLPAVSAPISTCGWASSRRSSSPPAYPLAPATATLVVM